MKDTHDPGTVDLFDDYLPGRSARDEALHRVLDHEVADWKERAYALVYDLPCGWEGIGEDVRHALAASGLPPPHAPEVWGAIINTCVRRGWLIKTGRYDQMRDPSSHARESKIYRRAL